MKGACPEEYKEQWLVIATLPRQHERALSRDPAEVLVLTTSAAIGDVNVAIDPRSATVIDIAYRAHDAERGALLELFCREASGESMRESLNDVLIRCEEILRGGAAEAGGVLGVKSPLYFSSWLADLVRLAHDLGRQWRETEAAQKMLAPHARPLAVNEALALWNFGQEAEDLLREEVLRFATASGLGDQIETGKLQNGPRLSVQSKESLPIVQAGDFLLALERHLRAKGFHHLEIVSAAWQDKNRRHELRPWQRTDVVAQGN